MCGTPPVAGTIATPPTATVTAGGPESATSTLPPAAPSNPTTSTESTDSALAGASALGGGPPSTGIEAVLAQLKEVIAKLIDLIEKMSPSTPAKGGPEDCDMMADGSLEPPTIMTHGDSPSTLPQSNSIAGTAQAVASTTTAAAAAAPAASTSTAGLAAGSLGTGADGMPVRVGGDPAAMLNLAAFNWDGTPRT